MKALQDLDRLIKDVTVLTHYDENKPPILSCNALPYGVREILAQLDSHDSESPIAFISWTLEPAEKSDSQLDKKGLAIVYGVNHFHRYITSCLSSLLHSPNPSSEFRWPGRLFHKPYSSRMTRWCLKLVTYDSQLIYSRSHCHQGVDALRWLQLRAHINELHPPGNVLLAETSTCSSLSSARIAKLTQLDLVLFKVYAAVQQQTL